MQQVAGTTVLASSLSLKFDRKMGLYVSMLETEKQKYI
jgi:hypothetical protein